MEKELEKYSEFTPLQRQMLLALERSKGIVMYAVRAINISREAHYNWCRTNEAYKKAVEDIKDDSIDYGIGQLFILMEGQPDKGIMPCKTSVWNFLKTIGKERGFSDNPPETDFNITINVQSDKTPDDDEL